MIFFDRFREGMFHMCSFFKWVKRRNLCMIDKRGRTVWLQPSETKVHRLCMIGKNGRDLLTSYSLIYHPSYTSSSCPLLRQHSGERPYKCELCGWQCRDHNALRRHRTIHIDFKPFRCPHNHCKLETREASYFKRHMLKRHPNVEVVYKCSVSINFYKLLFLQLYMYTNKP